MLERRLLSDDPLPAAAEVAPTLVPSPPKLGTAWPAPAPKVEPTSTPPISLLLKAECGLSRPESRLPRSACPSEPGASVEGFSMSDELVDVGTTLVPVPAISYATLTRPPWMIMPWPLVVVKG